MLTSFRIHISVDTCSSIFLLSYLLLQLYIIGLLLSCFHGCHLTGCFFEIRDLKDDGSVPAVLHLLVLQPTVNFCLQFSCIPSAFCAKCYVMETKIAPSSVTCGASIESGYFLHGI